MNVENINRLEWLEYFEQLITLITDVQNHSGLLPQNSELLSDRLQVAVESLHHVYSCVDIAKNDIENILLEFQVLIQILKGAVSYFTHIFFFFFLAFLQTSYGSV